MSADLASSLAAAGHPVKVLHTPDGSRLVILPYGARVLGLYAADNNRNFYWTHPALERADTAASVFAGDGWHNTGGDLTWVTPELDIFFPDYPDTRRHWEPPQLDAAEYDVTDWGDSISLTRRMTLHFARADRDIQLELSKRISPAPNPFRNEQSTREPISTIEYAGYTQTTTLELCDDGADTPLPVGIWNLVQVPHGGEVIVPTYFRTQPRLLFGNIPEKHLSCDERTVRFRACFQGEHKFAIRAAAATGRIGCLRNDGDDWSLVVRNFPVNPSGEYVDVPKDEPDDRGYAVHVVSVDSALGKFCELEYHAPAIGCQADESAGEDVSQVWAFRGPEPSIRKVARRLLGAT